MAAERTVMRAVLATALLSGLVAASARADVVIGTWENATDGWIDWGTQAAIAAPKYQYSTIGATHGTTSLKVTQDGWNQNLSIKLQNNGLRDAFFQNQQFQIDFSVPGVSDPSGYTQVYGLALNAEGYGFIDQGANPKHTYGYPNGGPQTTTLTWNYSQLVDGNAANGEISRTAGWIEFILATNSDATHGTFYFDNARLTTIPNLGDFNNDTLVNALDIELLFDATEGEVPFVEGKYDVNNDGLVTTGVGAANSDSDYWVQTLKGTRYGDANLDKSVNFDDLLALARNYGKTTGGTWDQGSFNGDGDVDFDDLLALARNYGFTAPTTSQLASLNTEVAADWALAQSLVPEPGTLAAIGLAGTLVRRRRR